MQIQATGIGIQPSPKASDVRAPALWEKWGVLLSCCTIVALCLVVGLPTVRTDNYFLGDDFGLVHHLHKLPLGRFLSYFVSDWTEGIYGFTLDELRPFLAFTYWLDGRMFGAANAQGYHATNVVLHMLDGLLVFAIARSVAPGRADVGLLAGSLFVLTPSHAEPISWISGRVDSLAALFYLGAFLCFVRFRLRRRAPWYLAALLIFACGLFAKQTLITFPLLILAYDFVFRFDSGLDGPTRGGVMSRYAPHVPFFLLLAAYLGLRQALFGNAVREDSFTLSMFKAFASRQYYYATKLLPIAGNLPFATKAGFAGLMIVAVAACGWPLLVRRSKYGAAIRRVIFFGAIWYAITITPMIVTYPSARHLYLTSAGLSIALASLILPGSARDEARWTAARAVVAGGLVALCGVTLTSNIGTWIANGVASHKTATGLSRTLRSLPRGSLVLIDVPESSRGTWFWAWGLPFALQKPFVPEDLYDRFAIVEHPGVYCRPPEQWWEPKRTAFITLLNSPGPHEATYISSAPQDPGSLVSTTRTVSGPALRRKIEGAMGKPVESLSSHITSAEAQRLAGILFE